MTVSSQLIFLSSIEWLVFTNYSGNFWRWLQLLHKIINQAVFNGFYFTYWEMRLIWFLLFILAVSPSSTDRPILDDIKRKVSMDQFNQESITNELIKSLRYMNLVNKQNKAQKKGVQFTWGNIDSGLFAKRLITVSKLTTEILKYEPRLLHISSPVYVLGNTKYQYGPFLLTIVGDWAHTSRFS